MRIIAEQSAGILIDVQQKLFPHIDAHDQLESKLKTLISGLQLLGIPILVTEQYTKGLGETIPEIKHILNDYSPIEKLSFSCCDEVTFSEHITDLQKQFFIIAGIETHVCVLQTVIDLITSGYQPVVVSDCVSSRYIEDKKTAIDRILQEGAIVTSTESLLFELTRKSGTPLFKEISRLVK